MSGLFVEHLWGDELGGVGVMLLWKFTQGGCKTLNIIPYVCCFSIYIFSFKRKNKKKKKVRGFKFYNTFKFYYCYKNIISILDKCQDKHIVLPIVTSERCACRVDSAHFQVQKHISRQA
jgi:hypothetical protein